MCVLTYAIPLGSTMNSLGPVLSTPPMIALTPNGLTDEYSVYACTYMANLLTTSYIWE